MALEKLANNQTWMDMAAGMWNHAPLMNPTPTLSQGEMRKILAFVWETQYLGPRGNPAAGGRVFETAGCLGCHRSPGDGTPMRPRVRGEFTAWSMVALGWGPARAMHQQMLDKNIAWPNLSPADVGDLVAYLNSLPGR
jgi:mono/diheme cytochrome c family protein